MYRVLTTGGTGFVGRHLMKYLGSLGYEIDNISKAEFMHENFGQLDTFKPDIVVHCAWPKIDLQATDHLEFAELTCHFFGECKKRGIRVINLGSSSEYGVKYEPMREDMICEPINTYGIAKLAVTLFAKKLGFNTLRLFTVVGEGGAWDYNRKLPKQSSCNIKRHGIKVEQVCKYIERLMHAEHLYGEIINIADLTQTSLRMDSFFEEGVADGTYPQSQYEPLIWEADMTKMRKLLNL